MNKHYLKMGMSILLGRTYIPMTKDVALAKFSFKVALVFFIFGAIAALPFSPAIGAVVTVGAAEIMALSLLDCRDAAYRMVSG